MGGDYLCGAGDWFIVEFGAHRVVGVFLYLESFEALWGRGESVLLHDVKLVGENQTEGLLVVSSMG